MDHKNFFVQQCNRYCRKSFPHSNYVEMSVLNDSDNLIFRTKSKSACSIACKTMWIESWVCNFTNCIGDDGLVNEARDLNSYQLHEL